MSPDKQRVQQYLKAYDFATLFREELGWDTLKEAPVAFPVDSEMIYTLRPLVQKRGFKVYLCSPAALGHLPTSSVMRQIERELTKHAYEHLIIYTDAAREQQAWQWVKREPGNHLPLASTACTRASRANCSHRSCSRWPSVSRRKTS